MHTLRASALFGCLLPLCLALACSKSTPSSSGTGAAGASGAQSPATASSTGSTTSSASSDVAIPVVTPVCKPGSADVNVTIVSKAGPLSGQSPQPWTNKMLSQNIDDLTPGDYDPSLNANFVAYLKALKPAFLRWPAGYNSQTYQFSATQSGNSILTPAFLKSFLALCQAVGAEPLIGINTLTGTADNAASLVTYLNKTMNANVTWFHIGNEPDVDPSDANATPATYAATFNAFRSAMLAADASIKLVGAELTTGARVIGSAGQPNWLAPILAGTQSGPMDAIDWHYYPKDSSQTLTASSAYATPANLMIEDATDWPPAGLDFAATAFPLIKQARDAMAPKAELWVDEFAEDSGQANGTGTADVAAGALWVADALGRFAEQGANAVFRFIFKTAPNHGYALLDPNEQLRPDYYAYWLYANTFGDSLVSAQSSAIAQVAAHAAVRQSDGSLRVMLINKQTTSQTVSLTLSDFTPSAAGRYQLSASSYTDTTMPLNNTTLNLGNINNGEKAVAIQGTADACATTVLTLPPVSVTVMAYAPANH